ncbi:proton myo-inositol cotransporter-like isoform X1 [Dreissena polymorpha]|uniref:proton myo-inositol cotransporter-like isoform X1 n=1 Tax=Dreissena polymorpha TaxID=45954 RepID=UPI002264F40F|nr:proton myo-inositol cotransporter-like isoform X1 [Dreissena polymorpha]
MGAENGSKYEASVNSDKDDKGSNFYVYYLTCFATIGGLLFGYDTGIISGSMLLIGDNWSLTTIWKELIVSATVGAAAIFALIAGYLTDYIGRKKVVMIASVIFTIGAVIMGASTNKEMLLVGRLVVGAGIGFASMSIPVYVAEASPPAIRGRLVTINQLFITIGIVISSVVAGLFSVNKQDGWRYMLGLAGIPSVIQFFGFFGLPESPRWLMEKGRRDDARKALQQIRKVQGVENELQEIQDAIDEQKKLETGKGVLMRMLGTQPVRRALVLGCGMQLFQQLCGINTVIYYSASILKLAGFPVELAIWLVCVPNVVNCLCTFIGIWLVERSGRRWLTIMSMIGVMIGLAVLAIGFQLSIVYTPDIKVFEAGTDGNLFSNASSQCFAYSKCEACISNEYCGFCYEKESPASTGSCLPAFKDHPEQYAFFSENTTANGDVESHFRCNATNVWDLERSKRTYYWADSYCPTDYSWMAILGLALFVMGFAPGLGPMPWTINSEIYPLWARSTGTSLATATNWVFNLIVSLTFLSLLESIGKYGTFWLYFGICFLGLIFMFLMLPETKNRSLEEVQELFMSKEYKAKLSQDKGKAPDTHF